MRVELLQADLEHRLKTAFALLLAVGRGARITVPFERRVAGGARPHPLAELCRIDRCVARQEAARQVERQRQIAQLLGDPARLPLVQARCEGAQQRHALRPLQHVQWALHQPLARRPAPGAAGDKHAAAASGRAVPAHQRWVVPVVEDQQAGQRVGPQRLD
ncbi:MAG TPA: hypothetical protein VFS21_07085, partial [Roseiflexaceae bacterium]|nr:hypothetical protein [Roseiflexaceae bacterium]